MSFYKSKRRLALPWSDDESFVCAKQHAVLSRARCARMYEKANGGVNPRSAKRIQIEEAASNPGCRGCATGYAHHEASPDLAVPQAVRKPEPRCA